MIKSTKKPLVSAIALASLSFGDFAAAAVLEEVMVTAQKRQQSTQDLGLSVSAFTGNDLRTLGVEQPIDLAGQTPGLSIGNALGSSNPAITVRGVGINDFNTNTNPGVAVYVDEIYQPIPAALSFGMFDLGRVEVLKGPQGTLYGRNATGGAVGFFSNKPTDELDGYITADYGNYEYKNIEAAIGGALSDTVRGRIAGVWTDQGEGHQDVFVVDATNPFVPGNAVKDGDHGKIERNSVRAQLEVDFSDTLTALLSYTHGTDTSDSQLPSFADDASLATAQAYYYTNFGGPACYNCVLMDDVNNPPEVDMESDAINLKLDWDIGFATLTSMTGHIDMDHLIENDFVGTELPASTLSYGGNVEQISQELRLTSNEAETVDWIVGLYYSKTEQENLSEVDQTFGLGFLTYLYGFNTFGEPVGSATQSTQEQTSLGLYAHTEWHLSDQWKLTVAGRFSEDELDFDAQVFDRFASSLSTQPVSALLDLSFGPDSITGLRTGGLIAANSERGNKESSFSWKLGLDYHASDDLLLYGNVSTGFKNQGFYGGLGPLSSQYTAYEPEEIVSVELGFKATLAEGALQINGAVFKYTLDDPQVIVSEDIGIGAPNDVLWNVGEAEGQGAELDVTWVPTDALMLRFGIAYLDSEMTDVSATGKSLFVPLTKGEQAAYSPELTYNGLIRYDLPVTDSLNAYIQTDFDWRDDVTSFAGRTDTILESRTLVNARLGVEASDGKWEVALWGKNLGDEEWAGYTYVAPMAMDMHQAPRTYGISMTYNIQ